MTRQLPESDSAIRSGRWQTTIGTELAGKTLGVVGLGRLGQRVAKVGLAFEMEVLAWSQNFSASVAEPLGVVPTSKEELLARSDVVSPHLRLSERTRGIIGSSELAQMKQSAYLVNTSGGPQVDEPALISALESGGIAGAALDVYGEEPLPADHPFAHHPRHGSHASPGVRHRRWLPGLLRRCRRGHRGLAGRHPPPRARLIVSAGR